jgi:endonuclease YncB( thermonuclease family)
MMYGSDPGEPMSAAPPPPDLAFWGSQQEPPQPRGWRGRRPVMLLSALLLVAFLGSCASAEETTSDLLSDVDGIAALRAQLAEAEERAAAVEAAASQPAEEATREPTSDEDSAPEASVAGDPGPEPVGAWEVVGIVDGDTIDVRSADGVSERVRIIGIDTPERGGCGFSEASAALASMISGKTVQLAGGARDDRDRYDRILRYVDVDGVDAGRELIAQGFAIARYDSRDGYGGHPREADYVAVDAASPAYACATSAPYPAPAPAPAAAEGPGSGPGGSWKNCAEARNAGAAPVYRGEPGYGTHLDGDNDGIGCE